MVDVSIISNNRHTLDSTAHQTELNVGSNFHKWLVARPGVESDTTNSQVALTYPLLLPPGTDDIETGHMAWEEDTGDRISTCLSLMFIVRKSSKDRIHIHTN